MNRKLTTSRGDDFLWSVMNALPGGNNSTYRAMTIVIQIFLHGHGISSKGTDVEMGRLLHMTSNAPLATYDGMNLATRSLSSATMATLITPKSSCFKLLGYNVIGEWIEDEKLF